MVLLKVPRCDTDGVGEVKCDRNFRATRTEGQKRKTTENRERHLVGGGGLKDPESVTGYRFINVGLMMFVALGVCCLNT